MVITDRRKYFSSRISARAVAVGTAATLASMVLIMSLESGIGGWPMTLKTIQTGDASFWFWAYVGWIVSVFLGARLATAGSRSVTFRDGFIQGVAVWAFSSILGLYFLGFAAGRMTATLTGPSWAAFLGGVVALAGAIGAGRLESILEERAERLELRHDEMSKTAQPEITKKAA